MISSLGVPYRLTSSLLWVPAVNLTLGSTVSLAEFMLISWVMVWVGEELVYPSDISKVQKMVFIPCQVIVHCYFIKKTECCIYQIK